MLRSFLSNTKYLLITSSIALTSTYAYCYWRCNKNKKQYLQAINAQTLKDASRLTNQSFGISWGFQADDTVMNSLDSGDLFFIKYDCLETLSPLQMLSCYRLTIPLLDEEYHAIGVGYRDVDGLMVYGNQFGRNKLMRYSQLVSLPYIKELMVQKTKQNVHNKLVKLLEEDRMFNNEQYQQKDKNSSNISQGNISNNKNNNNNFSLLKQSILQIINPKQNSFTFINRVLRRLCLLRQHDDEIIDLRELLSNQKQVNIRTETNKMLRSL